MLTLIVLGKEHFDQETSKFSYPEAVTLELEHSLSSLSKWESKWEKPFLGEGEKTSEQVLDYFITMTMTPDVPPEVFGRLSQENILEINAYIDSKQSATWFGTLENGPKSREIITSELVYYWMTIFHIPFECQYWHLNRLFTLIRVCNEKQTKPKPMSKAEIISRNRALNAQRKAQLNTKG